MTNRTNTHTDSYWLGSLSMSIVWALAHDKPKPFLHAKLREFLSDRPRQDPLAAMLRETLNERKR